MDEPRWGGVHDQWDFSIKLTHTKLKRLRSLQVLGGSWEQNLAMECHKTESTKVSAQPNFFLWISTKQINARGAFNANKWTGMTAVLSSSGKSFRCGKAEEQPSPKNKLIPSILNKNGSIMQWGALIRDLQESRNILLLLNLTKFVSTWQFLTAHPTNTMWTGGYAHFWLGAPSLNRSVREVNQSKLT